MMSQSSQTGMSKAAKGPGVSKNRQKSAARLAACQIGYERGFTGDTVDMAIRDFLEHRTASDDDSVSFVPPLPTMLAEIVRGVSERTEYLDHLIDQALESPWSPERLEPLLRSILRCGVWEIVSHDDLDLALIIKEYVEITDAFYEGAEIKFTNAILDRIGRGLRMAKS